MFTVVAGGCVAPLGHFEEYFGALRGALSHKTYITASAGFQLFAPLDFFHLNRMTEIVIILGFNKYKEHIGNVKRHRGCFCYDWNNSNTERVSKTQK